LTASGNASDEYKIDPTNVMIPVDMEEYFAQLKVNNGIILDNSQRAWYTAKYYQFGPDSS
jgi:hypothetical protein